MNEKVNVLIMMAGRGKRFKDQGYETPKPLLKVNNEPLIKYVIECMRFKGAEFIFIVRDEHIHSHNIGQVLLDIEPNAKVITISEITEGSPCTALKAKSLIDTSRKLFLKDCDQVIDWMPNHFLKFVDRNKADGAIVTINTDNAGYSYSKVDGKKITRTAEKVVISSYGNAGIYYFNRGSDFVKYAKQMINKNIRTNNEFYVSPIYNELIEDGKIVLNYPIAEMFTFNTPAEFMANKNFLKDFERGNDL